MSKKPLITVLVITTLTSIVLSILFFCLIRAYPRCMFYAAVILTLGAMLTLTIFLFATKQILPGILMSVVVLLFAGVFFCCFRKQIELTIIIVKLSSAFLLGNFKIMLIPLILNTVWILAASLTLFSIVNYSGG